MAPEHDLPGFVRAASLAELQRAGRLVVRVNGRSVLLVALDGRVVALDNRCPHMGFPLHRGSICDGILTCEWHHARFDLCTGGSFDLWADDAVTYPVRVRGDEVWVDASPRPQPAAPLHRRLLHGLEHDLPLVLAKAAVALAGVGEDPANPVRLALELGCRRRDAGWGRGLTQLVCFHNLSAHLDPEDRPLALYAGLSAVAEDIASQPPRVPVAPLPASPPPLDTLHRWFRRFVELRDAEGAERCLVTAIRAGAPRTELARMLFAAATDHRFLSSGHVLDFMNKALEALDAVGWDLAETVLPSLVPGLATASRAEESSPWRQPEDLVAVCEAAFARLPSALAPNGSSRRRGGERDHLVRALWEEDFSTAAEALLDALAGGASPEWVAGCVAYAAALRVARFAASNDFSDWDTALHTFSFASAVHQAVRRVPDPEVARGIFDAAAAVHLDRFLNVSGPPLPAGDAVADPAPLLGELAALLDRHHQAEAAAALVATYLRSGGPPERLIATLGHLLLREDRNFHSIQMLEAAVRQHTALRPGPEADHVLVAAARYLAAHAPTPRAQYHTFTLARRLQRGEDLHTELGPD